MSTHYYGYVVVGVKLSALKPTDTVTNQNVTRYDQITGVPHQIEQECKSCSIGEKIYLTQSLKDVLIGLNPEFGINGLRTFASYNILDMKPQEYQDNIIIGLRIGDTADENAPFMPLPPHITSLQMTATLALKETYGYEGEVHTFVAMGCDY